MMMINNKQGGGKMTIVPTWFEVSDLPGLGWIQVYHKGEENLYFEYKNNLGHVCKGFIKMFGNYAD